MNSPSFEAGDILQFKAGTTCTGVLSPKGTGTSSAPITITNYTTGATAISPVINGNGAAGAALTLTNQDYWKITGISVTNPASALAARQGIHVTSSDNKTHTGITIDGNTVYSVAGQTNKATEPTDFSLSCGILVDVSGTGRYDNVLVQNNQVSDCGGGAIKVRVGTMTNKGANAHVTQNNINACGGDGIIISYGNSPLIDYNVASNLGTGQYPYTGGNFAGMWVLGDYNPTIRHNVVYGTIMSDVDSEAFDCDWGNSGNCTVEYNYTHDNAGGAFLNCDGCGTSGGATQIVRYNVFQNDCRMYSNGDNSKMQFYQNVMYCPDKNFDIAVPENTAFTNNIFVGNSNSTLPNRSGISWEWNVFQNVPQPTNNGILQDPQFESPGTGANTLASASGYKLKKTSPALNNGAIIPDNGGQDFYGDAVSSTTKPNRGAYQGSGL